MKNEKLIEKTKGCSRCGNELKTDDWMNDEIIRSIYLDKLKRHELIKEMEDVCYNCYMEEIKTIKFNIMSAIVNNPKIVNFNIIDDEYFIDQEWIKHKAFCYSENFIFENLRNTLVKSITMRYGKNVDFLLSNKQLNENVYELSIWIKPNLRIISDEQHEKNLRKFNKFLVKIKTEKDINLLLFFFDGIITLHSNHTKDMWIKSWDILEICNNDYKYMHSLLEFYEEKEIEKVTMEKIMNELEHMYNVNYFSFLE